MVSFPLTSNAAEAARSQLDNELQGLRTAASGSSSEVQTLESRIKTLEAQNRDAMALHEAKSQAHDRLADDLAAQHQKLVALRKQLAELEEKNQTLENQSSAAKYREQNLQREIDALKKSADWYESELNTRTADNSKFRKEKNAQIAGLQRANADATQTIESLRRTEASQCQRIEELDNKVEQSLVRIQQLQDDAAQAQQQQQQELESTRRLAMLHQESANTARQQLQNVNEQLAQLRDNAAHEVGLLQAEVDSERQQRVAAENQIAELERQIENLEAAVTELRAAPPQVPVTPRRGFNASVGTPGRAGSPGMFSPGSARSRAGLSTAELYAENVQLKKELRAVQEKETNLNATMQEMLSTLESIQPELDEVKQENERLTNEASSMSEMLHDATREREQARKDARKARGDYEGLVREKELLRKQLRDISTQVSILLLHQRVQQEGMEALTPEEAEYFQRLGVGEEETGYDRTISEKLVVFQNIQDLQQKNEQLLGGIRELSDRLEGAEARESLEEMERTRKEVAELREKVATLEEQAKSTTVRFNGVIQEREMYKHLAMSRGRVANGDGAETPPPGDFSQSVQQTPRSKEIAGYEKLIKDLQAHLDAIRQETATDLATLRQQTDRLTKENHQLQTEKIKAENALQLATERFELHTNKVSLLESQNSELKKRCDSLQDQAAKQDIQTQQVMEDLLQAKNMADSLSRENANLKATRDITKATETRLQEENATLMEERARLNKMISDLQNLRNEQELTEADTRRRLQSKADNLEAELQNANRKLEAEMESHKKASLVLENEQMKSRSTINDLREMLNNIRPELAAVKTERDHLQARVDELKAELRIAEERGQSLQARPTSGANGADENSDDDISREEQLSIEISNLRQQLEAAHEEAESARVHAAKFQEIATEIEEQMESQNEVNEEYRAEMENIISEKDKNIKDLETRVEEISSEIAATNSELSELRRVHGEQETQFNHRKEELEAEITRLTEECDRYKQTAEFHQKDLKAQAEIATQAQKNYDDELVRHSEAIKSLQKEREEHNKIKSEVSEYKTQAEAARAALAENEELLKDTRQRYDQELAASRTKINELQEQNKILHKQLENVSAQIAGLKESRLTVAAGDASAISSGDQGQLQDVVNYLRQEKEILEVQYELAVQSNKTLEGKIKTLQDQLDQAREMLSAAQQSQAQNAGVDLEALQRNVEQLNTMRESNTTLRNEARQAVARLEEKTKEVEGLYAEIQPLQARVSELEVELESTVNELKSSQENAGHWQKRCQDVLHKYDRIDPAELESLKEQLESLQGEVRSRQTEIEELQRQVETLQTERDQAQEELQNANAAKDTEIQNLQGANQVKLNNFKMQAKERDRQRNDQIKTLQAEIETLAEELKVVKQERDAALDEVKAKQDTIMAEEGQVEEGLSSEDRQALEAQVQAAEHRANEEANRAVGMHIQLQGKDGRIEQLESQLVGLPSPPSYIDVTRLQAEVQSRVVELNTQLAEARSEAASAANRVQELEMQLSSTGASTEMPPADVSSFVTCLSTNPRLTSLKPELQQRIESITNELNEANEAKSQLEGRVSDLEAQLAQAQSGIEGADIIEKLRQDLATAQKELDELRSHAEQATTSSATQPAETTSANSDIEKQVEERVLALKQEVELTTRKTVTEKFNNKIKEFKAKNLEFVNKLKADHAAEIAQIQETHAAVVTKLETEKAELTAALDNMKQNGVSGSAEKGDETPEVQQEGADGAQQTSGPDVKMEQQPTEISDAALISLSKPQIQKLLNENPDAKEIVRRNIIKRVDAKLEELRKEHAQELEKINQSHAAQFEEVKRKHAEELQNRIIQFEEQKAGLVTEEEVKEKVVEAKALGREDGIRFSQLKISLGQTAKAALQAKLTVVEEAAKTTPEKPVGEVWEVAKVAKAPPKEDATRTAAAKTPSKPVQPAGQVSVTPSPSPAVANAAPQPGQMGQTPSQPAAEIVAPQNPFQPSPFNQAPAPQPSFGASGSFGRPSGPPIQAQQNAAASQIRPPSQAGQNTGLPQPGFGFQSAGQNQANVSCPNSPFVQAPQQQQPGPQAGRGRGQDNVGTGPAALRSIVGQSQQQPQPGAPQQTGIPRPGGGIPRPAGRGAGAQQQGQNAGPSQIGRGGGRGGRGGGRGGGAAGGQGLNPNAPGFSPGQAGRGQKRKGGDDGDESQRGGHGKRARGGGRGGQGGGAAAGA